MIRLDNKDLYCERLGVPDYYGLYIEPNDDDCFIIYNQDEGLVRMLSRKLKEDWFALCKESTESIKEFMNEEYSRPIDFYDFIDEYDIDYDNFSHNGARYNFDNKQIQIIKSFMPR